MSLFVWLCRIDDVDGRAWPRWAACVAFGLFPFDVCPYRLVQDFDGVEFALGFFELVAAMEETPAMTPI